VESYYNRKNFIQHELSLLAISLGSRCLWLRVRFHAARLYRDALRRRGIRLRRILCFGCSV
jgi:hypothetical protein